LQLVIAGKLAQVELQLGNVMPGKKNLQSKRDDSNFKKESINAKHYDTENKNNRTITIQRLRS
jgi:hypothetical protein